MMESHPPAVLDPTSPLYLQPLWLERAEAALVGTGKPFSASDVRGIAYQMRNDHTMPFFSLKVLKRGPHGY